MPTGSDIGLSTSRSRRPWPRASAAKANSGLMAPRSPHGLPVPPESNTITEPSSISPAVIGRRDPDSPTLSTALLIARAVSPATPRRFGGSKSVTQRIEDAPSPFLTGCLRFVPTKSISSMSVSADRASLPRARPADTATAVMSSNSRSIIRRAPDHESASAAERGSTKPIRPPGFTLRLASARNDAPMPATFVTGSRRISFPQRFWQSFRSFSVKPAMSNAL